MTFRLIYRYAGSGHEEPAGDFDTREAAKDECRRLCGSVRNIKNFEAHLDDDGVFIDGVVDIGIFEIA